MPIIAPDSFETGLRNNQIAPLYFLFGDEEFLIDEALALLLHHVVDESTQSFNYDQFHGSEAQLRDVVERATAYPMMAERRVVVLRDLDRAISSRKSDDGSGFFDYIAAPSETTTLILTATTASFLGKKRSKPKVPYDLIVDGSLAVHFRKVYDRELPSWVTQRISRRGKKITPDAVEMFVSYVGASLRTLNNEIEKLFTYVEDRPQITLEDVQAVVGASRTWNIFELQKAISEKKLELSVEIAERMLRAGEPPQLILTMLTRYFTILWRLLEIRTRFRDQKEMAREVGISSFFINEYLSALSKFGLPGIRVAFEALLDADLALKSTRISHSILMQMLLVSIIQGENIVKEKQEHYHQI